MAFGIGDADGEHDVLEVKHERAEMARCILVSCCIYIDFGMYLRLSLSTTTQHPIPCTQDLPKRLTLLCLLRLPTGLHSRVLFFVSMLYIMEIPDHRRYVMAVRPYGNPSKAT